MAVFNEPTQWGTSLVVNGDTNVIPQSTPAGSGALSFNDGFPQITQIPLGAGGIAPDRKDFNAVMKLLGDALFYMQNGGWWSYNSAFDYAVGRIVLYNNNLYKCIRANGVSSTVVTPTNSAYWSKIALSSDIGSFANTSLSNLNTTGQSVINSKANTSLSNLNTTGQSVIDSKANTSLSNLNTTGQSVIDSKANTSLSNLSAAGQDILDRKAFISLSNLNDTGNILISRNAMPSRIYDELTLGASGTSYTAPSNGYVYIAKVATAVRQYLNIESGGRLSFQTASVSGDQTIRCFMPIAKGATFSINYSLEGTTITFRFVYAIGSVSEKV